MPLLTGTQTVLIHPTIRTLQSEPKEKLLLTSRRRNGKVVGLSELGKPRRTQNNIRSVGSEAFDGELFFILLNICAGNVDHERDLLEILAVLVESMRFENLQVVRVDDVPSDVTSEAEISFVDNDFSVGAANDSHSSDGRKASARGERCDWTTSLLLFEEGGEVRLTSTSSEKLKSGLLNAKGESLSDELLVGDLDRSGIVVSL